MYQMLKKKKLELYALGQHISMSADKARRVIDQIRGRSYEETLMILELMPHRAGYPIFKLVYSVAANASYTMASNEANLVISKADVNEGTTIKKFKPRARGRSYPIKRTTCHITIVLKDISLDDSESIELNLFKKSRWKKNSKGMAYYDLDNRGERGFMGQKINPLGFRLGTTQGHHSLWFSQPKNYSESRQEDQK